MPYSGTDPESYITEYTLVSEDYRLVDGAFGRWSAAGVSREMSHLTFLSPRGGRDHQKPPKAKLYEPRQTRPHCSSENRRMAVRCRARRNSREGFCYFPLNMEKSWPDSGHE